MVPFIGSILRRRRQADDPFASEVGNWVDDLAGVLIYLITALFVGGGLAVFIASFSCGFSFWIGLSIILAATPISYLVIIFSKPARLKQEERERERRRRREELLQSNDPLRRMPITGSSQVAPSTVPSAAVTAKEGIRASEDGGKLEV
ncbi:hypothetical protein DL93DRAFT_2094734 [Clavulina sp. PMI_390]|nr:hypothetical protein DL93DRAFT_2094734 [Clavulina sp. PMI_390]